MEDLTQQLDKLNKSKQTKNGKTRSQIGKSSKTKGKAGERFFASALSKSTKLSFLRVPNSGAFVGQRNRNRLETLSKTQQVINLGDIICPEELKYCFIFESKNYEELDFHNLINPKGSTKLLGWLDELLYDVQSAKTYMKNDKVIFGFLLVKITRKGSWIIGKEIYTNTVMSKTKPSLTFNHNDETFFMCDFQSFIDLNKDQLFETIL